MKYVVIILVSFLTEHSRAQDLISVANTFLNDKNYIEAKAAIDEAFEDSATEENPRAWYTKARVYHEILKSNEAQLTSLTHLRLLLKRIQNPHIRSGSKHLVI